MPNAPKMRRAGRAVQVRETAYGQGVFSRRRLSPRELVGLVTGTLITDPDYWSAYAIGLDDDFGLEPSPPFRFLNHSCEPNCKLVCSKTWNEQIAASNWVVRLVALRSIGVGEQLTIDYAWAAVSAIPCECGMPTCRGWIVARDEVGQLPERCRVHPSES